MDCSVTSTLTLSTESNQVAAEEAGEIQISDPAVAEDGSLTHITIMDPAVYVAAEDGDIHVLEEKAREYDIHDQQTPKKNTVLHIAAQFGQSDCVKWILQLPSPSSLLQQSNEKGDTPLHLAAREGHLTVVQNLIHAAKQLQEDPERGDTEVCMVMLRMTNNENDTAIHEAVRYNHPKVVELLILEDPHFTYGANTEGNTPLYIAAEWGFRDLVEMILGKCTSPGHIGMKGRTALHAAVIAKDPVMTRKILEKNPALTKELDEEGWSPLHFAAYVGCHPTIVSQLLDNSDSYVVYLGVKGYGNRTALHIAVIRGHVEVVKMLLSRFPDCCEKVDNKGNNVLHLIVPERKTSVISCLSNIRSLRARGLANEKNVEGKTPFRLFHDSDDDFPFLGTVLKRALDPFVKLLTSRSSRTRIRPLGSLEIREESDSRESRALEIREESDRPLGSLKIREESDSRESRESLRPLGSLKIREESDSRESRESLRPLGSLKIREESDSREIRESIRPLRSQEIREESKEIYVTKKTFVESYMVVAALIATVAFAAAFTLPGGYIQNETLPGSHIQNKSQPGGSIQNKPRPGGYIQNKTQPGGSIQNKPRPGGYSQNKTQPGGYIQNKTQPGSYNENETLPDGFIRNENNSQGMAVFSLPINASQIKDQPRRASDARADFKHFVIADIMAMVFSLSAIAIYLFASLPITSKRIPQALLLYGHVLTLAALATMVYGFAKALQSVLHHAPLLEGTTKLVLLVFVLVLFVPFLVTLAPILPRVISYCRKFKMYTM